MQTLCIIFFCFAAVMAMPKSPQRIIGGSLTTISQYPYGASIIYTWDLSTWSPYCGGTIITKNAVLSAAHCFDGDDIKRWRIRVGSSFANSGGTVHTIRTITIHPDYNPTITDNDVSVLRTDSNFKLISNKVQPASIAGPNYNVADNEPLWAIGWGLTAIGGNVSEQLRHVEVWKFNQETCRTRLIEQNYTLTDNMLCSGWIDKGERGQCSGDSGSPVIHYSGNTPVVVGICSWGVDCASFRYGDVNTLVSRYTNWILAQVA